MLKYENLLLITILLPLLGFFVNGILLRKAHVKFCAYVATAMVFLGFIISLFLFASLYRGEFTHINSVWFDWIRFPLSNTTELHIPFALYYDRLSAVFLLVITGVGSLIHLYSLEYMVHDETPSRFFSYMNLFVASMLTLVLGANMLVTFIGWEGVGVCSYFLIGYWYSNRNNGTAALKAFVMNRIGDIGFIIAMFLCFLLFHTLDYSVILEKTMILGEQFWVMHDVFITGIGICILIAASGKSAQIPLLTWLPDAMAGPTPVSALIHAATMVTAGLYLFCRTSFLLTHSPVVMLAIAIIGVATAFLAATVALFQNDIKKVLAFSTVSQLGYMVLACGVGAFEYAVGHVITHAFFKAALFLGAGAVIHVLHEEQDIRHMGGLFKKMPITGTVFIIATLAIIGLPPFAGFFSKDAILAAALSFPQYGLTFWILGVVTAAFTSFYMVRLTTLVFFGESRGHHEGVHDPKLTMTGPLMVLAFLSMIGGVIVLPEFLTGVPNLISTWLSPNLATAKINLGIHHMHLLTHEVELSIMLISVFVVLIAAIIAVFLYRGGTRADETLVAKAKSVHGFLVNQWYLDSLYNAVIVKPYLALGEGVRKFTDPFIDAIVKGLYGCVFFVTSAASHLHSGVVRNYIRLMFVGTAVLFVIVFMM